jgi:folate-dependent phosphoribosylglycinamide formyltransferase PurN
LRPKNDKTALLPIQLPYLHTSHTSLEHMTFLFLANSAHRKPFVAFSYLIKKCFFNKENTLLVTDNPEGKIVKLAKEADIPNVVVKSNSDLEKAILSQMPEYLISCGWPSIIPEDFLSIPSKASLNCHSSFLPDYKGASVFKHYWSNWESRAGASVHLMTKKFDEGNIISQEAFTVSLPTTPLRILNETSILTSKLIKEAIESIENGCKGTPQRGGRYFFKMSNNRHVAYWVYNGLATILGYKMKLTPHKIIPIEKPS